MSCNGRHAWRVLVISISFIAGCAQLIGIEPLPPLCMDPARPQQSVAADIIIAIDTSASMREEVDAAEASISDDLAAVLDQAGVDYRIILLADFPPPDGRVGDGMVDPGDPTVCIGPPLSPQDCAELPPGQLKPDNGDPATSRFFHYDVHIDSRDALFMILGEFDDEFGDTGTVSTAALYLGGWGQLARADSLKIFIVITDDDSTGVTSEQFDTQIRDKLAGRFPEAPEQRYVFHAVTGMAARSGDTIWYPDEPVQTATCTPGAQSAGEVYQRLSIMTGGLRFPLCSVSDGDPGNDDLGTIFNAIAATAPCSHDVPADLAQRIQAPGAL